MSSITRRQRLKQICIGLGIYKPVRRLYDWIEPNRTKLIQQTMELLSRFVRPGDLCFDVGANVGRKTAAMLQLGARVVAVEPQPACIRELKALYGNHPRFTLVPKAIGREPGSARLYISPDGGLSSLNSDWFNQWVSEIDVAVTTLDTLIDLYGTPRYCKLDIEGSELEALHGLSRPLEYVSLEFNNRYIDQTIACLDYLGQFTDLQFNLTLLENDRLLTQGWWDRDTFLRRFHEELARNPEHWGGDVFIKAVSAT
jgi:FkbM family methyltransferase